ncbi:TetR/AcrR family transcriptional regulator C-terminal domain-containing protein [Janibacter terrae]|uniref:TetR/AcrR family transcriptional regulator C-terminal domain-containing protein n=1 Tax=Janibacter terrae TaxID=103817 RepID=A0ABZ2F9Y6_9MICO|nr:TetR/AcrR family transcriptional regulator C-terminal domain-containing protein [Janibacter terrae]MBA4085046.1 TetR family transcriptional regulator [Kytococcus sp.]HCA88524.1 TetR family transcriptional regulator [Streptomyces sp.]
MSGTLTRGRLSRDLIVRAALAYIDAQGPQKLTMRSLGKALGVEAMSLYRHVSGREDLLEAVVAHLLRGLEDDLDVELVDTWQGYLQTFAHEVRRVATEHPSAFPLIATRHPAAPWLRPPLRSLSLVEDFLHTMIGHGFGEKEAVRVYRAFSSFLLGHLLLESVVRGAETAPVEVALDEGQASIPEGDADMDLSGFPTVERLRRELSEDHSKAEFEIGLETLIERIELHMSQ